MEGKVSGITKFGAFVSLPDGRSGLVHISEISYTYVNDVKDHLQEGQAVKVKLIGVMIFSPGAARPNSLRAMSACLWGSSLCSTASRRSAVTWGKIFGKN